MASNQPQVLGGTAIRPKERHGLEAIQYLIYNKETGEVFTRTPKSWLLITVFYVIYYTCLAGFWAAMLMIFFQTLPDHGPKWTTTESLIGVSPGLGMRPKQTEEFIDSSMVAFAAQEKGKDSGGYDGWGSWVDRIDTFLKSYENTTLSPCNKDDPATADKACKFDISVLGNCNKKGFGYDGGKPCIYLKLNKIFGNVNLPYNDPADLPKEMPEGLKNHIASQPDKDMVWVDCRPEQPADLEIVKSINYYPKSRGFPNYFFPYTQQTGYQSPLVAVQFDIKNPGQLVHVECRAWAKNIGYDKRDRIGIVHFEILKRR